MTSGQSDDLSVPRWMWWFFGALILALPLTIFLVFWLSALPEDRSSKVYRADGFAIAPPLKPATPRRAAPNTSKRTIAPAKPRMIEVASGVYVRELSESERRLTLGFSEEQAIGQLSKWAKSLDLSTNAQGERHHVVLIDPPGPRYGQMILVGKKHDLRDASFTVLMDPDDSEESLRFAAGMFIYLDQVVPEFAGRKDWYIRGVEKIIADLTAKPVAIIGEKRMALVGIPTSDGILFALCLSHKDAADLTLVTAP